MNSPIRVFDVLLRSGIGAWLVTVLVALLMAGSGCATALAQTKPPPKLADVDEQTIDVHFLGHPYQRDELYVCSGISGKTFDCITWVEFETSLKQGTK